MSIKPQLAEDAILDEVIYPCWIQPKIDGVRALHMNGAFTGRSLKPFKGFGVTEFFSNPAYEGLDGEMTLGPDPTGELLCSATTGAMGRFKGTTEMADLYWWVFDLITPETVGMCYAERYSLLAEKAALLQSEGHSRIKLVPRIVGLNREELGMRIASFADDGYEGTIIRNPWAVYKEGRATQGGQELWRVKPWGDFEILVTGVTEGQRNENEAKVNPLGRTERSSAQAGMVPNGQVGSVQGTLVADYHDPFSGKLLFAKGLAVTAGSGKMTVDEATAWFVDQEQIVGHFAKIKTMTYGVKDLPRFPTFETKRLAEDMS